MHVQNKKSARESETANSFFIGIYATDTEGIQKLKVMQDYLDNIQPWDLWF